MKKNQFYGKPVDWVNVREEIGDVLWYLALLGRASGSTLEECGTINVKKREKRYPETLTAEHAERVLCRDPAGERHAKEQAEKHGTIKFKRTFIVGKIVAYFPSSSSE